ncbi:SDR family NAD(P)-dependent oxidoreductase [uncultured Microbacterium sp.]|uniref:SDR family NAD(P)-dependent oxidoreductase n=1 Tax=Microbacterium algeriense TaxID=2615184 RepID=UPI002592588C|nr:SDR family oxidoreductase [uncultured Microbacterium sp.]
MELELTGKRAFVSGSTEGIGYAIAAGLVRAGAAVVVNGRDEQRLRAATEKLRALRPDADVTGIVADFADAEQVRHLLGRLGEIDILVNNVGIFDVRPFTDIDDEEWQRYFDVNVMSGVRLSRHVLGGMLARGWGRIVFVASESGIDVPADMTHYGATKAAMLALANGLAKSTRGTSVTVNSIVGGPTYSEGVARAVEQIALAQGLPASELKQAIAARNTTSLLERFIEPEEIAQLALYLASPRSSATNGAALRADGGTLTTIL